MGSKGKGGGERGGGNGIIRALKFSLNISSQNIFKNTKIKNNMK